MNRRGFLGMIAACAVPISKKEPTMPSPEGFNIPPNANRLWYITNYVTIPKTKIPTYGFSITEDQYYANEPWFQDWTNKCVDAMQGKGTKAIIALTLV